MGILQVDFINCEKIKFHLVKTSAKIIIHRSVQKNFLWIWRSFFSCIPFAICKSQLRILVWL